MTVGDLPTLDEIYAEASRITDDLERRHEEGENWGDSPDQEGLSNYFVWDLEENRFYGEGNEPDELVVLPNVYGGFANGTGFSLMTPLSDKEDEYDAREVLGEDMVKEFEDGVPGVEEVDGPRDVMETHYLADSLGIDVYRLASFDEFLDTWIEDGETEEEWPFMASRGVENLVGEYTRPAISNFVPEAIEEFSGNGKRTAFILYANRSNESYPEEPLEMINEANQGGLAYHTPKTINQVMKRNVLEE